VTFGQPSFSAKHTSSSRLRHRSRIATRFRLAGVLGGGTFVLASVPAAAIAFTAPIVIASAIAILRSADPKFLVVAVLISRARAAPPEQLESIATYPEVLPRFR
jgi:hypothetical protein